MNSDVCVNWGQWDLLGRYYRIDGTIIDNDLHERVNAIPIDTLQGCKERGSCGWGPQQWKQLSVPQDTLPFHPDHR